jgi:hypothetical protein
MKKVMSAKKAKVEDVATIFQKSCSIYETLTENLTDEEKLGLGRSRRGIDIVICGDGQFPRTIDIMEKAVEEANGRKEIDGGEFVFDDGTGGGRGVFGRATEPLGGDDAVDLGA